MSFSFLKEYMYQRMSTRRKRTPKKSQRLYSLNCCWENCDAVLMIQVNEYGLFSDHLQVHANDFVQRLRHEAGIEVELGNEDCTISCCCMWRSCSWEGQFNYVHNIYTA